MSDELIIRHCSPTLAGLKTASLFSCSYVSEAELTESVRKLNHLLSPKGIRIIPLRRSSGRALIYLYRPAKLRADMSGSDVRELLSSFGYSPLQPDSCVAELASRLRECEDFPHEIGLFLGYPPEDVRGFIENHAGGSKLTGAWKVYGDEEKARRTFAKYRKCTAIYMEQLNKGKTIERLTVAGI